MTDRTARWAAPAALALFVALGAVFSDRDAVVMVAGHRRRGRCGAVPADHRLAAAGRRAWSPARASRCLRGRAFEHRLVGVLRRWLGGARSAPGRCGWPFTAAVAAVIVSEWIMAEDELGWAAWIAGTVFTVVFALMARRQGQLIDELRAAQAGLADRARVEERNRIARELHDVIGHALTVSQLHVSSARLAVEEDPPQAVASLVEAERLGLQSLREVRHAVGLLREDGDPSGDDTATGRRAASDAGRRRSAGPASTSPTRWSVSRRGSRRPWPSPSTGSCRRP